MSSITFHSSVIFVRDVKRSRQFYEELLGQEVEADFGINVGYVGGFAIWEAEYAQRTIFGQPRPLRDPLGQDNVELYFESETLESTWKRTAIEARVVHPIMEQPWGQRVFRVYDPDGYVIEIAEPMPAVVQRFMGQGMSLEDISRRTGMPLEMVQHMSGEMLVKN